MVLVVFLVPSLSDAKLVKTWADYEKEYHRKPAITLTHGKSRPIARRLTGEGEDPEKLAIEPKETGIIFLSKIKAIVNARLQNELGVDGVVTTDGYVYHRNGQQLLDVKFELLDDEDQKIQSVLIQMENVVISMELSIEKTKLKGYVQDYLFFYVSNGVLSVKQTVLSTHDVFTDFMSMVAYVCDEPRGEVTIRFTDYNNEKEGDGERRLSLKKKNKIEDRTLKARPILGAMKVFPLDVKSKKYISTKPGVKEYIKNLELPKIENYEPRERKLTGKGGGVKMYLQEGEQGYFHEKSGSFRSQTMMNKDHLRLSFDGNYSNDGNVIEFLLFTSRSNLPNVKVKLTVVGGNNPVKLVYETPSFIIIIELSVPTTRFIVLHARLSLEELCNLLQIIDHLNDLRVWRDFFPGTIKYHWRIHELFQPSLIQMMYREMFDNLTDGQTASTDPDGENILEFSRTMSLTGDDLVWVHDISSAEGKMLHCEIVEKTFGETMETSYMTSEMYVGTQRKSIYFGNREVPTESMFNQHFLLKKYMEVEAEFVIRSSNLFQEYKDDITPFITDAYRYSLEEEIPKVQNPEPGMPIVGYRFSTDRIGAKKLEVSLPGDHIFYELCPVLSTEYHDQITVIGRKGYFYTGGRFYFRKDVDYCYQVMNPSELKLQILEMKHKQGGGEEERRLKENISGQLV